MDFSYILQITAWVVFGYALISIIFQQYIVFDYERIFVCQIGYNADFYKRHCLRVDDKPYFLGFYSNNLILGMNISALPSLKDIGIILPFFIVVGGAVLIDDTGRYLSKRYKSHCQRIVDR